MKRQIPALVATFLITGFMTLALSVVGVNAMYNKAALDASTSQVTTTADIQQAQVTQLQAQVTQLQALVVQYQQRETEYQQRDQQYQQQIQQDQQQLANTNSQLQQLLQTLQAYQLIRVESNGQITIIGQPGY